MLPAMARSSPATSNCSLVRLSVAMAGKRGVLLPVVLQNLFARRGQFGAVLLQAGKNGEVTLIHDGTAMALNVADAGLLLLRRSAALRLHGWATALVATEIDNRVSARTNLDIIFLHYDRG